MSSLLRTARVSPLYCRKQVETQESILVRLFDKPMYIVSIERNHYRRVKLRCGWSLDPRGPVSPYVAPYFPQNWLDVQIAGWIMNVPTTMFLRLFVIRYEQWLARTFCKTSDYEDNAHIAQYRFPLFAVRTGRSRDPELNCNVPEISFGRIRAAGVSER